MKKKRAESGFSIVEVLLVVVVVVILVAAGFFAWQKTKKNDVTKQPVTGQKSKDNASSSTKTTPTVLKTYTNDEFKFSFQYPSNWKLSTDLNYVERGAHEGDVVVESPNGTKVHFGPNLGGKGGDCADENENYTAQTCSTRTVISLEKISNGSADQVYFYHFSLTDSIDQGGKTIYYIDIENGETAPTETGPTVGVFLYPYDEVKTKLGYVTVYVEGKDDDKNNSPEFFNTSEVKEATPILKSFKLFQ